MSDADAPHASPTKRASTSFFGKLMDKHKDKAGADSKKDSNADSNDPSSSPTASPEAAATPAPAKGGRGASGAPTADDLQLLMDQLSALSQSLADASMSNKELRDNSTRLQLLLDQSKVENQFMLAKCEAQEKEMSRLREKISFANLDATNEALKQAKAEAAEVRAESEALKAQNQILYQNYADINAELQTMHEDVEAKAVEIASLHAEKASWAEQREALEVERADEAAQATELRAALASLEERASSDRDRLRASEVESALAEASTLRDQLTAAQTDLHAMTTDRNRCRRLAESCQQDVKKAHSILASRSTDSEKLLEENQKLRQDLQRKSKSLQDALQALNNAATSSGGSSGDSASPLQPALGSSSTVSGRDLLTLQSLCNRLSESLVEKESQLSVLKKQCLGLGKRVIELEAGTIPDFSDKAWAAREAEEREKQSRDRREIEGMIEQNERRQAAGAGSSSDGSESASASASASAATSSDFYSSSAQPAAGLSVNAAAAPLQPSPSPGGPSSSPLAISTPLSPSHQRLRSTQLNSSRNGSRRSSGTELP